MHDPGLEQLTKASQESLSCSEQLLFLAKKSDSALGTNGLRRASAFLGRVSESSSSSRDITSPADTLCNAGPQAQSTVGWGVVYSFIPHHIRTESRLGFIRCLYFFSPLYQNNARKTLYEKENAIVSHKQL